MNLRKLILPILSLLFVVSSCKKDDEMFQAIPDRDRQEVYDENLIEIEEYLATHFYNYEEFDAANPYSEANDAFTVVIDTISEMEGTANKIPLIDQVTFKTVVQDDIDYKLYYLVVREGLGKSVNPLDRAAMLYRGTVLDGTQFDSAVSIGDGQPFNLTSVGNIFGVVAGFREGIIEFKTATGNTPNLDGNGEPDGTVTYNDHGIGAVFMPSGLGYFSLPPNGVISQYSPLIFTLNVISRSNTDFDLDGVPSHVEHPDGTIDGEEDNTDGDLLVNFIDNDDDGDGVLTRDEVIKMEYEEDEVTMVPFMSRAEAQAYFDDNIANNGENEIFVSIEFENDGTFTLNTLIVPDHNNDGIPNYLDAEYSTAIE